jgi:hypothetical protein
MAAGNYAAACPKFSESLRLDVGVGTSLWLAECFERSGKIASAWAQFREAAATAVKTGDPREKVAREHASVLEPKLPKLIILVPKGIAGSQLSVTRDGETVGPALWGTPVPIDAGDHSISVSAQGKKTFTTTAHIVAAPTTESVTVPILEDDPNASAVVPEPAVPVAPATLESPGKETPSTEARPNTSLRLVGIAVGGVGVAGLVIGTVFGIDAMSNLNESNTLHCKQNGACPTQAGVNDRNAAQSLATGSTIAFAAGGALVVGGALLYVFAPKITVHKTSSAAIVPTVGPSGSGLAVLGAW